MARRFFDIASAINAIVHHDDSNAFEFIFDHFYDKLIRIAIFYLKAESMAEDAISEVFFKLWENRKKLKKIESLEKYLFTMSKNQCLYVLRSNKKMEFNDGLVEFNQQIVIENPETELISREFISFFNKKIRELPPKCKLIYLMVKEDGLKYKEVANLLSISVKTVENQMTKAIAHIRRHVNSYQSYHNNANHSEKL